MGAEEVFVPLILTHSWGPGRQMGYLSPHVLVRVLQRKKTSKDCVFTHPVSVHIWIGVLEDQVLGGLSVFGHS